LIAIGPGPSRVRAVENGVDFYHIQRVRATKEESDIIFVGRLVPHKRVDLLLKAVRIIKDEISDVRCIVIGDGPERGRLEALSRGLGLRENVRFLGRLKEHDDVIAYMKASKVFVLPSTREGFPNTVLEANASGLPAITVIHPKNATTAVIYDGENGFKCRLSENALAEKIKLLLTDEELRMRMLSSALRFAEEHDWGHIVKQLISVYEEAIDMVA